MARYFFHVRTEDGLLEDDQGVVLADRVAAKHEALLSADDLRDESEAEGADATAWSIEVVDENDATLEVVPVVIKHERRRWLLPTV